MKKLEESLLVILEKALSVAEQTGEFAIEQAPLLLKEFYVWHVSECVFMSVVWFAVAFFVHLIYLKFGLKSISEKQEDSYALKTDGRYYKKDYSYSESSDSYIFATIFNIAKYLPLIGVFVWMYELLHIVIAPKLYLIEYFIK